MNNINNILNIFLLGVITGWLLTRWLPKDKIDQIDEWLKICLPKNIKESNFVAKGFTKKN